MLSLQLPTTQQRACESFYVLYFEFRTSWRQGPALALRGPHGESIVLIEVESSARFPKEFKLTLLQPSKIDVQHALRKFEGSGVVIARPPIWDTDGHMTFSVNDPDGREVQVLWLTGNQAF
jgi:hypothetical protein